MKTKLPKEATTQSNLEATLVAMCKYAGLPTPTLQHQFHPDRKWRWDLSFPGKVAVEVHGGTWTQGRHTRGCGFQSDREKVNEGQIMGYLVLEFTAEDVRTAGAVNVIARALKSRGVE